MFLCGVLLDLTLDVHLDIFCCPWGLIFWIGKLCSSPYPYRKWLKTRFISSHSPCWSKWNIQCTNLSTKIRDISLYASFSVHQTPHACSAQDFAFLLAVAFIISNLSMSDSHHISPRFFSFISFWALSPWILASLAYPSPFVHCLLYIDCLLQWRCNYHCLPTLQRFLGS